MIDYSFIRKGQQYSNTEVIDKPEKTNNNTSEDYSYIRKGQTYTEEKQPGLIDRIKQKFSKEELPPETKIQDTYNAQADIEKVTANIQQAQQIQNFADYVEGVATSNPDITIYNEIYPELEDHQKYNLDKIADDNERINKAIEYQKENEKLDTAIADNVQEIPRDNLTANKFMPARYYFDKAKEGIETIGKTAMQRIRDTFYKPETFPFQTQEFAKKAQKGIEEYDTELAQKQKDHPVATMAGELIGALPEFAAARYTPAGQVASMAVDKPITAGLKLLPRLKIATQYAPTQALKTGQLFADIANLEQRPPEEVQNAFIAGGLFGIGETYLGEVIGLGTDKYRAYQKAKKIDKDTILIELDKKGYFDLKQRSELNKLNQEESSIFSDLNSALTEEYGGIQQAFKKNPGEKVLIRIPKRDLVKAKYSYVRGQQPKTEIKPEKIIEPKAQTETLLLESGQPKTVLPEVKPQLPTNIPAKVNQPIIKTELPANISRPDINSPLLKQAKEFADKMNLQEIKKEITKLDNDIIAEYKKPNYDENILKEMLAKSSALKIAEEKYMRPDNWEKLYGKENIKPEEVIKTAELLGQTAFKNGLKNIPIQDKEIQKLLEGKQPGESKPILEAWLKGWDKENLKSETKPITPTEKRAKTLEEFKQYKSTLTPKQLEIIEREVANIDLDLTEGKGGGKRYRTETGEWQGIKSMRPKDLQNIQPNKYDKYFIAANRLENGYTDAQGLEYPPDVDYLIEVGKIDKAIEIDKKFPVFDTPEEYNYNKQILDLYEKENLPKDDDYRLAKEGVTKYETRQKAFNKRSQENSPEVKGKEVSETRPLELKQETEALESNQALALQKKQQELSKESKPFVSQPGDLFSKDVGLFDKKPVNADPAIDLKAEQQKEIEEYYKQKQYEESVFDEKFSRSESAAGIKASKPEVIEKAADNIIKRKDISLNLAKKIKGAILRSDKKAIAQKSRSAAGIYTHGDQVARAFGLNDLTVVMHELTHYIDDALVDLKPTKQFKFKELSKFKAEKDKLVFDRSEKDKTYSEAVAELLERYIVNPEETKKLFPNLTEYITNRIKDKFPEIMTAIEDAHRQYVDWLSMTPEQRILSNASIGEAGKQPTNIDNELIKITQGFLDRFASIEAIEKKIGKGKLPFEDRPYIAAWNIWSAGGKAESLLKYGQIIDANGKVHKAPSYREVLEKVGEKNLNSFRAYLLSRAVVLDNAITPIAAKDAVRFLRELSKDKAKLFQEASDMLRQYNNAVLQYYADAIGKPELVEYLNKKFKAYVPLYRNVNEDGEITNILEGYGKQNLTQRRSPIKKRKGSLKEIIDPLENIIKSSYMLIQEADTNMFRRKLLKLLSSSTEGRRILEHIKPDKQRVTSPYEWIRIQKQASGLEQMMTGEDWVDIEAFYINSPNKPQGNVMEVKIDGRPEYFKVHDPLIWESINGIGQDKLNTLTKLLEAPARWIRAGIQTPEFIGVTNPLRDNITAVINTKNGFIPIVDYISGLFSTIKQDKDFKDWMSAGGYNAFVVAMDRVGRQKKLEEITTPLVENFKTLNPIEFLQSASIITEAATRLGEYKRAIKKGKTPIQAAWESKEVTTNFAKHGLWLKSLDNVTAFLRANTQGRYRLYKTLKNNPIRSAMVITSLMLGSVGIWLLNQDDPEFREIPREMKDIFWFFKIGNNKFKIPKPDIAQMFVNPIEYYLDYKEHLGENLGKMTANLVSSVLPGDLLKGGYIPTAIKPIIENFFNRSLFFGGQIVPENELKVHPRYRELTNTSEIINWFSKILPDQFIIHPEKFQNLARGWAGSLAGYVFKYSTLKYLKDMKISDLPFLKGFMWDIPEGMRTDTVQTLFEKSDQYQKYIDTYNTLKKYRKIKEAKEYMKINKENYLQAKKYNAAKSVILKRYKVSKLRNTKVDQDLLDIAKKYIKD